LQNEKKIITEKKEISTNVENKVCNCGQSIKKSSTAQIEITHDYYMCKCKQMLNIT